MSSFFSACVVHLHGLISLRRILLLVVLLMDSSKALSSQPNNRRSLLGTILSTPSITTTLLTTTIPFERAHAAQSAGGSGIQGVGGTYTRVEGMGGGFDIRTSQITSSTNANVIYPASMAGVWNCRRIVTSVEGDVAQAELAWRNLGGTGPFRDIESFDSTFAFVPEETDSSNNANPYTYKYKYNGDWVEGVVLDRKLELKSRMGADNHADDDTIIWNIHQPDTLSYTRPNPSSSPSPVEIVVVQRKVESPTEQGFGYDELYRVTSSAGGTGGILSFATDANVERAVRVRRRYRRAFDERGNRILEGLEIANTYRVLDGIAGIEMPTSTCKSSLVFRMVGDSL